MEHGLRKASGAKTKRQMAKCVAGVSVRGQWQSFQVEHWDGELRASGRALEAACGYV